MSDQATVPESTPRDASGDTGAGPVNLWTEAAHAVDYLEQRRDAVPHRGEGYDVLAELLVPVAPRRVLDLGTGDGHVAALVRAAHPGVEVVACDFSEEMLRRARERFAGVAGTTVVAHDLTEPLPAQWGRFDAVVSAFAIHHLTDQRKRALYAEVLEHLEPGGIFANLEHVASSTPGLHAAFVAAIGGRDDPSNQLAAPDRQLRWLRDVGYDDVDCLWRWRELALLTGRRPASAADATATGAAR